MTKDNFSIIIVLFPSYWNDNIPEAGIYLDGKLLSLEKLTVNQEIVKLEFPVELDYGEHEIAIKYENKNQSDIFWHEDKRLRENFIKIEKVFIDFSDLGNMVKQGNKIVTLFNRNEYTIKFHSPVYYWMLNNIDKI